MREKCFVCDKPLRLMGKYIVMAIDDQTALVGPECYRKIEKADLNGLQPPKGGPRLYTLGAKKTIVAANSYEELKASLAEMIEIYWGEGDGIDPPPACIQRAKAALSSLCVFVVPAVMALSMIVASPIEALK